jgi:hypothetical protein
MWVCLNDCFLSIVAKDCARSEVLVRARRSGDIQKIFPEARVEVGNTTDYRYRARVDRRLVADAVAAEVMRINYPNFKNSVTEKPLHAAYLRVWNAMADLQPGARQDLLKIHPLSGSPFPKRRKRKAKR